MTVGPSTGLGEEVIHLLTQLVSFPTESRSPNMALVDYVVDTVARANGWSTVVKGPEGRANVLLRFGPQAPGGALLSGHTDVVPAGEGWVTDPYALTVDDDRLWGRGTADMKGFIAAALAVALRQDVSRWRAPLYFGLSFDEEIGCAGVPSLLREIVGDPTVEPRVVVVGEPTTLSVRTSHAGKVAYTVQTTCPSGHSSLAPTRTNAIDEAVSIARVCAQTNQGSNGDSSTNVGTLTGGVAVNVLAPTAELSFECRHLSGVDVDRVLDPVWSQVEVSRSALEGLGGGVTVSKDAQYPAMKVDAGDTAIVELGEVLGSVPGGHLDFGSEAGLYVQELGIPTVVFGPGDIADAHRPNEFVSRSQLRSVLQPIQALCDAYCSVTSENRARRHAAGERYEDVD